MKPLVLYHADCADGFGAAFAAWLKLGNEAEYVPVQYHTNNNEDWRYDENLDLRDVYILDFSYPKEDMDYIFACAQSVVWLDHHKTAFEMYGLDPNDEPEADEENQAFHGSSINSMARIILDNNRSGAMIAWEYFHPDKEVPMLIKHIDDYDRWQFKLEETKAFMKALWSYAPWSFEQWKMFAEFSGPMLISEGAAILRAHEQNVTAVVKGASRRCMISYTKNPAEYEYEYREDTELVHYVGLAANCPPHLASDVGHQLATLSGTYGLLWYLNKDNKCKCSLRSNGDYDVSAIAKALGGGGHKNAAGFEVSIETLLGWLVA